MRKGLFGDGGRVSIYKNGWIPRPSTLKPYSLVSLHEDAKVKTLIKNTEWDMDILENNFNLDDISQIVSNPISPIQRYDSLYWYFGMKGLYSVKSGYHVYNSFENPPSSQSSRSHDQWMFVWSLKVPQKV